MKKKIKLIFRRIIIKKIKQIIKEKNLINNINSDKIDELNKENKIVDTISNKDLSESKENDLIEWEYSLLSLKQDNNKNNDNKNKEDNLSLPDLIIDE